MGPFKCPDCGVWWAGFEHRCQLETTTVGTIDIRDTYTVHCNCAFDRNGHRISTTSICPVHDINVTYTGTTVA